MFHRRAALPAGLIFCLLLLASASVASAQTPNTCTATIVEALTQAGVNCSDTPVGTLCYAFPDIEAELSPVSQPDLFDEPADNIGLLNVLSISPSALNVENQTWGVTVMRLQASLPSGFPENVVVLGLGGIEIENGVLSDEVFVPLDEPVELITETIGELRESSLSAPADGDVIGEIAAGTPVLADALSEDGDWVRVIADELPGWLKISVFGDTDLSELPVLEAGQFSPMQSFYFRTRLETGDCNAANSLLYIQAPQETFVDLVINNVPMRLDSTIVLRTIDRGALGRQMEIVSLYGLTYILPDTEDEIILPPGFTLVINFDSELTDAVIEAGGIDRTDPSAFGSPNIITFGHIDDLEVLEPLPEIVLNHPAPPPIIITPSGVGGPIIELIFEDPIAIVGVEELCEQGILPIAICQVFGFAP